ncbi:MAG: hypothetical protein AABX55_02310 [Nanoarchaeota archaeon]
MVNGTDSREGWWSKFRRGPREREPWWKTVLSWITLPFRWIFYFLFSTSGIVLMIVALIIVAVFVYNAISGGTAQAQITKVGDVLSKTPIIAPAFEFFKIIKEPSRLERTYSFKGEVDSNQENRELGLTFTSFKSIKDRFLEKEPISLLATVKAMSFKEDSQIKFSCKDTTSEIQGTITPSEPVSLEKNIPKIFTVRCEINPEQISLVDKDVRSERIVLSANYNFKTEAYVPTYTISDEKLKSLQSQAVNPFIGIDDPKLNENTGEAISTYNYGPMKVLVNSQFSQPFTEKGAFVDNPYYDLTILIETSNLGPIYQGQLNKINNVYLYLPNNFELAEEEIANNFDIVEQVEDEDLFFTRYKLKEEKINQLNDQCKNYKYDILECASLWERGFTITLTKFKVAYLENIDLTKYFIRAEVDYEFQAETSKVITIVKSLVVS